MIKFMILLAVLLGAVPARADSAAALDLDVDDKKIPAPSGRRLFVVETDSDSAAESLNRIAGEIDMGFIRTDDEFKSEDHYRTGPFSRQEQMERSEI